MKQGTNLKNKNAISTSSNNCSTFDTGGCKY